jgi:uncharacterized LabA/DUF88 family protein
MNNFEKTAIFIDGENLYHTAKALGFDIDFKRLLTEFETRGSLLRCYYYTAVSSDVEDQVTRPLTDWLDYNGFTTVAKPAKVFDDGEGRRKFKRNIAIEIVIDALEIVKRVEHIVLFSGDGDFRSLIEAVQRRGVRVTVVSTIRTKPPMIADELRRQADSFLELNDLKVAIGRTGLSLGGRTT